MQCPDCGSLRHDGECDDPVMEDIAKKAKAAREAENDYLSLISQWPLSTRTDEQMNIINIADDTKRRLLAEYRNAILADPNWKPWKEYPKVTDY